MKDERRKQKAESRKQKDERRKTKDARRRKKDEESPPKRLHIFEKILFWQQAIRRVPRERLRLESYLLTFRLKLVPILCFCSVRCKFLSFWRWSRCDVKNVEVQLAKVMSLKRKDDMLKTDLHRLMNVAQVRLLPFVTN